MVIKTDVLIILRLHCPAVVPDLIVQAKSGTGKTCVFCTIALDSLVLDNPATQVSRFTRGRYEGWRNPSCSFNLNNARAVLLIISLYIPSMKSHSKTIQKRSLEFIPQPSFTNNRWPSVFWYDEFEMFSGTRANEGGQLLIKTLCVLYCWWSV